MIGKVGGLWVDVGANLTPLETGLAKAKVESEATGAALSGGLGGAAKAAEKETTNLGKGLGKTSSASKLLGKDLQGLQRDTAKTIPGLGGMGNSMMGLPAPALAAAAAIGVLAIAGKSMIDIGDKWEASQKGLAQATESAGVSNEKARKFVDQFIGTNTRFVSSQAEVVDSYAALTREGLSQTKVQEDLNLALDLSKIKHIGLADATTLLAQVEMGRGRALIPLGIQMKDYPVLMETATQASKKLETAEKAVEKAQLAHTAAVKAHGPHSAQAKASAQVLHDATVKLAEAHSYAAERAKASAEIHDLLHKKLDNGRKTTSDLEQAQNQLGNAWQTFAQHGAPVLLQALSLIFEALNHIFEAIGWVIDRFSALVGAASNAAHIASGANSAAAANAAAYGTQAVANVARQRNYRAGGGPVVPGITYTVGEKGPELFSPDQPGTIIPHGSSRSTPPIHVHIDGIYAGDGPSLDILANKIAQRLGYTSGR